MTYARNPQFKNRYIKPRALRPNWKVRFIGMVHGKRRQVTIYIAMSFMTPTATIVAIAEERLQTPGMTAVKIMHHDEVGWVEKALPV